MNTASQTAVSATFDRAEHWHQINWREAFQTVRELQIRIAKAAKNNQWRQVAQLQRLLVRSFYGRSLAVRRVTENRGKRTAGVDNQLWQIPKAKWEAIYSLTRRGYQPKPLKRVYIPKVNGQQRPLSIPTMKDRAMQALYLLALEPISETLADPDSYGFRPQRATADAIEKCFTNLNRRYSAQWVLEGDIKSCFDQISHDWLLKNIPMDKTVLRKWLQAGYMEKGQRYHTRAGTPQGGIISPVLANMALDGLERELWNAFGKPGSRKKERHKVNFVRYADDFIITGISKELLTNEVKPVVEEFLKQRGLTLSAEKTKVTHIDNGFDFLGWNVRKYQGKLLIKPAKENTKAFLTKIRQIIKEHPAIKQEVLIQWLNPVCKGWANYHRHVVAGEVFCWADHQIWKALWRWCKRRHPNKGRRWVKRKYFHSIGNNNWEFAVKHRNDDGDVKWLKLHRVGETKIRRHTRIRSECNPYDPEWERYLEQRSMRKMLNKLQYRKQLASLWNEQQGLCVLCKQPLDAETGFEDHHIIRKVDGGSDLLSNRVLLHVTCHLQVHHQKLKVIKPVSTET